MVISSELELIEILNEYNIDSNLEIIDSANMDETFRLISLITNGSIKTLYIYSEDLLSNEFLILMKNLCKIKFIEINILKMSKL